MPTIEGTYICEHCGTEFKWEALLRQKISDTRYPAWTALREGCVYPHASFDNDHLVELRCRCPNSRCDKSLNFAYHLMD